MTARQTLLLVTVVVIAGCSGLTGGGENNPTRTSVSDVTPVPVTQTQWLTDTRNATTSPSVSHPPGVFANGTVDANSLANSHASVAANQSYVWSFELARNEANSVEGNTTRLKMKRDADALLVGQSASSGTDGRALYAVNKTGYLANFVAKETTVRETSPPGSATRYVSSTQLIIRYLTGPTFDVTTVEQDGRIFYRLYAQSGPLPRATSDLSGPLLDVSITAYVTPDGFVRTLTVEYDSPEAGLRERVRIRYDYSGLGETTVAEPTWLQQARSDRNTTATTTPTNRISNLIRNSDLR